MYMCMCVRKIGRERGVTMHSLKLMPPFLCDPVVEDTLTYDPRIGSGQDDP